MFDNDIDFTNRSAILIKAKLPAPKNQPHAAQLSREAKSNSALDHKKLIIVFVSLIMIRETT